MVGADRAFQDGQAALIERFGFGEPVLKPVQCSEIVERYRDLGMARAQHLFIDRERALVERLGFGVPPLRLV
jgi:hypothetical protein